MPDYYISPILKSQLDKVKTMVTKKDRDFVMVIDGEEGVGKSVLGMQIANYLDPNFDLDKIVFNADQFLEGIKKHNKYSCIMLDEAFNASNARASLTEVNRSMLGVATEMRQRNLFVIMIIPSFFDLDKYFALWRCRALIHVYFRPDGARGSYVIFPKTSKKLLYLQGKRLYNYTKPASPFPACRFNNYYTIDEKEYRHKKAEAFKKRTVSNMALRWKMQREALIKELFHNQKLPVGKISQCLGEWGARPLNSKEIYKIVQLKGGV